jgi:hypothetical protein
MRRRVTAAIALLSAILAAAAGADTLTRDILGATPAGQPVSLRVVIDFTPTGGSFAAGTGTATARFTLLNTSGLFPFRSPAIGNPLLTRFFFNVPPGTGLAYTEARILAGATIFSSGTTLNGAAIPAGCHVTAADTVVNAWYVLDGRQATGQYGIFTNQLSTDQGNKLALADPALFAGCLPRGDFYSLLVIAGQLRFTLQLDHLGTMLSSAAGFLSVCSTVPGSQRPSSLGGKLQDAGTDGQSSAFIGDPCQVTPVNTSSWGTLKTLYR